MNELYLIIKCCNCVKDSINLKPYRIFMYRHTYPKEIFLNVVKMFYRVTNICHRNHL